MANKQQKKGKHLLYFASDVISGIEALFYMDHLTGDELVNLLRSSFNEIHAQSHVLADRSKIFAYHHFLLNNKLSQILPLGMDYLLGYIQVILYLHFFNFCSNCSSFIYYDPFTEHINK